MDSQVEAVAAVVLEVVLSTPCNGFAVGSGLGSVLASAGFQLHVMDSARRQL